MEETEGGVVLARFDDGDSLFEFAETGPEKVQPESCADRGVEEIDSMEIDGGNGG